MEEGRWGAGVTLAWLLGSCFLSNQVEEALGVGWGPCIRRASLPTWVENGGGSKVSVPYQPGT